MNKIIIFGAGKIGRSFIGQLFARGGYDVLFIDISTSLVNLLNRKGRYPVEIKEEEKEVIWVENVCALHISQEKEIVKEIADADYIALSVGTRGLAAISPILAKSIHEKFKSFPERKTDIILAENIRNGDLYLEQELKKYLPNGLPISSIVGIQETSIGKMVPIMPESVIKSDPLMVYAEAYNTLIVSSIFKNEIPAIEGLAPKKNIKAWVDRKLFIHNLGHAATAYIGNFFHPDKTFIYEVLEDPVVEAAVRAAMAESATVLQRLYPKEFSNDHITNHIDDLIRRFRNKSLADTIFRVGSDLTRKLSGQDRFVSPLKHALEFHLERKHILSAYWCAFQFNAVDQNLNSISEDLITRSEFRRKGIKYVAEIYSGLDPVLHAQLLEEIERISITHYHSNHEKESFK